jgi:hypothetical protein
LADLADGGRLVAPELVRDNENLREDRLVHEATGLWFCREIDRVAAFNYRQRLFESFLCLVGFVCCGVDPLSSLSALGFYALLLDAQHVFIDAVAIEELEQLLLLALEVA